MNSIYLWKIQQTEEDYPDEGKSQFLGIIKKFTIDFFKVERGNTNELQNLTKDLIKALRLFIRNIKIVDNDLISYVIEQYSSFHNEIIDLQREKALEIVNTTKQSFSFQPKVKRFLLSDLDLEYEINVYMTKVIQKKSLIFTEFVELFISSFKPFILDYSQTLESSLIDYIQKVINDFNHRFERALAFTKAQLESHLIQIIESISPVRVTVLMKEINEKDRFSPWMVCFEKMFDKEPIKLQQVSQISPSTVMITLSFEQSNMIFIAFNDNFIVSIFENNLEDSSTILCEGSTREDLLFIHNKLRMAFFAFERERKIEIKSKVDIFSENIEKITSAAILRISKEVVFVDGKGNLHFFSFGKTANETSKVQIVPTLYRSVGLSTCGNFLMLCGRTETYVLTNKLEMVIQDFHVPELACLTNRVLFMLNEEIEEGVVVSRAQINSDYISDVKVSTSVIDKVDYEIRATYSFGRDLIGGILEKDRFSKFKPPELNPK
jgi:hypothetical protein